MIKLLSIGVINIDTDDIFLKIKNQFQIINNNEEISEQKFDTLLEYIEMEFLLYYFYKEEENWNNLMGKEKFENIKQYFYQRVFELIPWNNISVDKKQQFKEDYYIEEKIFNIS